MKLEFHQKTFALLGLKPIASKISVELLDKVEKQNNIVLPGAVREWYQITDAVELMQELFLIHSPTNLEELSYEVKFYLEQGYPHPFLHVMWENQGVWSIAVFLSHEEDPPVFLGLYEEQFKWVLHAERFSDFLYAWAWDYIVFQQKDYNYFPKNLHKDIIDPSRKFSDSLTLGPTTYLGNAFLRFEYCIRYVEDGKLIMDYRYPSSTI